MAGRGHGLVSAERSAPGTVAPSSRVTVAFPFSKIELTEPSKELAELVDIVERLIGALETTMPGDTATELHERVAALARRAH